MNDLFSKRWRNTTYVLFAVLAGLLIQWIQASVRQHTISPSNFFKIYGWFSFFSVPIGGITLAEVFSQPWMWKMFIKLIPSFAWPWIQSGLPNINGRWKVTWQSNDPINEALFMVYVQTEKDQLPLESKKIVPLERIPYSITHGEIFLIASPVEVTVSMKKATITESNNSINARLYKQGDEIFLIYQSRPNVPWASTRDSEHYNFSTYLKFNKEENKFSGSYYTDRGRKFGQNTAGYLILERF